MGFNPFLSAINWLFYLFTGRIQFPKDRIGEIIIGDDGRPFQIFRQVIIKSSQTQEQHHNAIFKVNFKLAEMSPQKNIKFSLLAIPFFIGLPGFKSKLWMIDKESGYFQGIYEWDTKEHAERYSKSFAMKFMCKRSLPNSVQYTITSKSDIVCE